MKRWLLRLYCRWFGHKVHHETIDQEDLPEEMQFIGTGICMAATHCERCGAKDLYGWMVIKGYMDEIRGNTDVLKGKRPEDLEE